MTAILALANKTGWSRESIEKLTLSDFGFYVGKLSTLEPGA